MSAQIIPVIEPSDSLAEDDRRLVEKIVREHAIADYSDVNVMLFELHNTLPIVVDLRRAAEGESFDARAYRRALLRFALDLDAAMDVLRAPRPIEGHHCRPYRRTRSAKA